MTALAIDLGGTKLSLAVFTQSGEIRIKKTTALDHRGGTALGELISHEIQETLIAHKNIESIGVAVPGIYHEHTGTVWAPNIEGWSDYPLLEQLQNTTSTPLTIDSDRACYILGEAWMGNAKNCRHAIYLAVGTGIGAGILNDGKVLRGAHDIAGAIGWMALGQPFANKYIGVGDFEFHASGEGIARVTKELLAKETKYEGVLRQTNPPSIIAHDVFSAYDQGDLLAKEVFHVCVRYWGMAIANLVSLFNPEKIILGGGVFGPAVKFIPDIKEEAVKWAQPISMKRVSVEQSSLGTDAGLYGAALLAFEKINGPNFSTGI